MVHEEQRNKSLVAKTAWPLLIFTAVLHLYFGLAAVAYFFLGVPKPPSGPGAWIEATMGGFQAVAAVVAIRLASRRDLRGTILAVAGCMMLGWLSTLPTLFVQGINFHGEDKGTSLYFVIAPPIAITAAVLAWRNVYLIAAALLVSAMTFVFIVFVIAFGIIIAVHGF